MEKRVSNTSAWWMRQTFRIYLSCARTAFDQTDLEGQQGGPAGGKRTAPTKTEHAVVGCRAIRLAREVQSRADFAFLSPFDNLALSVDFIAHIVFPLPPSRRMTVLALSQLYAI